MNQPTQNIKTIFTITDENIKALEYQPTPDEIKGSPQLNLFLNVFLIAVLGGFALIFAFIMVGFVDNFILPIWVKLFLWLLIGAGTVAFPVYVRRLLSNMFKGYARTRAILRRYAASAGWIYEESVYANVFGLPGILTNVAVGSYAFQNVLKNTAGTFMMGNYAANMEKQSGSNNLLSCGVAAFKLSGALPHMYLNGVKNRIDTIVRYYPKSFDGLEQLSLEGDFQKYFKLFATKGEQITTLSVMAPDLMQTLVDYGSGLDIEIENDWLMIYFADSFKYTVDEVRKIAGTVNRFNAAVEDNMPY